jgi:hypothetical protein
MAITWITPTEITPGSTGWTDADLSAILPVGVTGVILHFHTNYFTGYNASARMNGSTDDGLKYMGGNSHQWMCIGVDENRIVEINVEHITRVDVWLVGYFSNDARFFPNYVAKSLEIPVGEWTDIDISSDAGEYEETAIGAIVQMMSTKPSSYTIGIRMNGSGDERENKICYNVPTIIGVDENGIFEVKRSSDEVDVLLNGYIKSNAVFNLNATDMSISNTGYYYDLSALPEGATGGFFEVIGLPATAKAYALRKNGSVEDIYKYTNYSGAKVYAFVECDENRLIEGKIESTDTDFFLIGYSTTSGSVPEGGSISSVTVSASGVGQKIGSASAECSVSISADGKGDKQAIGSSEVAVTVISEGGGEVVQSILEGGSEAYVSILTEGSGIKTARSPPSDSVINTTPEGYGTAIKKGSCETLIGITGMGTALKSVQDSGQSNVIITIDGSGESIQLNKSESNINVVSEGLGEKVTETAAEASLIIVIEGSGHKQTFGGYISEVIVQPEGSGEATIAGTGGSISRILIEAIGEGRKIFSGNNQSECLIITEEDGQKTSSGDSDALVLIFAEGEGIPFSPTVNGESESQVIIDCEGSYQATHIGASSTGVSVSTQASGHNTNRVKPVCVTNIVTRNKLLDIHCRIEEQGIQQRIIILDIL